jgi:methyl-accepting chemotaxis protein
MEPTDITVEILKDIRGELREIRTEARRTNERLDATNERLGATNERLDATNETVQTLVEGQIRLFTAVADLKGGLARVVEEQVRQSEGMVALVEEVKALGGRIDHVLTGSLLSGARQRSGA